MKGVRRTFAPMVKAIPRKAERPPLWSLPDSVEEFLIVQATGGSLDERARIETRMHALNVGGNALYQR